MISKWRRESRIKSAKLVPLGADISYYGEANSKRQKSRGGIIMNKNLDGYFQFKYRVRPHECSYGRTAEPLAMLNYLQDAAFSHSLKLGFSVYDLYKKGLMWVMTRYRIQVHRYPAAGEEVTIRTWYPGKAGGFYLREFEILDEKDEVMLAATSSWLILDIKSKKTVEADETVESIPVIPRRAIEDAFEPLPGCHEAHRELTFSVRMSDVDLNRHVNHTVYILWALESVPEGIYGGSRPVDIQVGYRAEGRFGDQVITRVSAVEESSFCHQLVRASDGQELARLKTVWG
jgi:acyl-ACP thioesterase